MCLFNTPSVPKSQNNPDPSALADAAAAAEAARLRAAHGYSSTLFGGNTQQPTIARKVLFGQ